MLQSDFVITLLISLGLTLILELAFSLLLRVRNSHDLLLIALVNVITNPAVVLLNKLLSVGTEIPSFLIISLLEIAAVLIEWLYYKRFSQAIKNPFLFSLGANAFSYFIGLIITKII